MEVSGKRRSKGPNFRVYVGTSFQNATFCEIEELAKFYQLPCAQVVRALFLRGLAAYHRDGQLAEEETGQVIEAANRFALDDAKSAV